MSTKQTLTGFTPGKWEFATFEPGKISGLSAGGIAIHANWNNADGYQPLIATIQPHWSNSAHEANARLIASAPTLLAQRNELREAIRQVVATLDADPQASDSEICNAIDWKLLRDVLAKTAEGDV